MLKHALAALACLTLVAPAMAEPPAEQDFAQKMHDFYQDHGSDANHLQRWGVSLRARGALTAQEAQQIRESLESFYRQAAERREASQFQGDPPLLPVRETLELEHRRLVHLTGRLLPGERELFEATVRRLRDRLPALAPVEAPEAPPQDPAAFRRFMPQVQEFYADVSKRIIDVKLQERESSEDSFHLCSICDITLDSCLDKASQILDDCVAEVGDFVFCTDVYFGLIRVCHNENINCIVALCS